MNQCGLKQCNFTSESLLAHPPIEAPQPVSLRIWIACNGAESFRRTRQPSVVAWQRPQLKSGGRWTWWNCSYDSPSEKGFSSGFIPILEFVHSSQFVGIGSILPVCVERRWFTSWNGDIPLQSIARFQEGTDVSEGFEQDKRTSNLLCSQFRCLRNEVKTSNLHLQPLEWTSEPAQHTATNSCVYIYIMRVYIYISIV